MSIADAAETSPHPPSATDPKAEQALDIVHRFTTYSGFGGLIPVPVVDLLAVGGVQLQMLRKLAELYGVPFRANWGKSVIASAMGVFFPISATATTAMTVGSALKAVPVLGTAVAAVTMPSFSAGATYLIGRVFTQHFASGGTLLDFHAPNYKDFIGEHASKLGSFGFKNKPTPAGETTAH